MERGISEIPVAPSHWIGDNTYFGLEHRIVSLFDKLATIFKDLHKKMMTFDDI
jgi:hypothetical protein